MSRAGILLLALAADALVGDPDAIWRRVPHPAALMGRLIGHLDTALNRGAARRARGAIVLAGLVVLAALGGIAAAALPDAGAVEAVLVAVLLAQGSLATHVRAVAYALDRGLGEARRAVAQIVGRDPATLDESGVARAAIESLAENFSDGVVAPALWYLVFGLPGIAVYKMVNTADSMIGYRTPRHSEFGWAAARLDDVLNWIPARVAAGLILLTSATPRGLAVTLGDAPRHRSPNAGWPEAATAAALGVALSGPRVYGGRPTADPFVNEAGRRDLSSGDIRRSLAVIWRAWLGLAVPVLAVWVLTR